MEPPIPTPAMRAMSKIETVVRWRKERTGEDHESDDLAVGCVFIDGVHQAGSNGTAQQPGVRIEVESCVRVQGIQRTGRRGPQRA